MHVSDYTITHVQNHYNSEVELCAASSLLLGLAMLFLVGYRSAIRLRGSVDCVNGGVSGTNVHSTDHHLAEKLQHGYKRAQKAGNAEVADGRANVQPGTLVAHHVEEVQRHDIRDRHHHHEQGAGCNLQPAVQNAQVGTDDGEGDENLQNQQGPLTEGAKDRNEPDNALQGE